MQVTIRPLEAANDADVLAVLAVQIEASARDLTDFPQPTLANLRGRLLHPWPGTSHHSWVADVDGAVVGLVDVGLPQLDNRHMAEVEVLVHPEHRRRGIGRALHAHAVAFAREHGRTTMTGDHVTQLPDGPFRDPGFGAFADAVGAKPALPEVRRRLDLNTVDMAAWDKLHAEALPHAEGYTPVRWIGGAPEEYVHDLVALEARIVIDVPMGDLNWEPEKVDATRVRANEEVMRKRGRRNYSAGMRHDATGHLVAWTAISFDAGATEQAWQQITIVDPGHRGHRLGLVVKIDNMRHTLEHEPALAVIDTWNAAENSFMISINETLGFRAVDGWMARQQEL